MRLLFEVGDVVCLSVVFVLPIGEQRMALVSSTDELSESNAVLAYHLVPRHFQATFRLRSSSAYRSPRYHKVSEVGRKRRVEEIHTLVPFLDSIIRTVRPRANTNRAHLLPPNTRNFRVVLTPA